MANMVSKEAIEYKDEIMSHYRKESEKIFERQLRLKGFNDEDIKNIIEVTDKQPIYMIGVEHTTSESVNGVVVIYSTKPRTAVVLPEVDPDKIERYGDEKPTPRWAGIILVAVAVFVLASLLMYTIP